MKHRTPSDAMRVARDIYALEIRDEAERAHHGEFVAIDVDSRRWRLADSELAAARVLRDEVPEAVDVCVLRVGYRAAVSLRGRQSAGRLVIEGEVNADAGYGGFLPVR